MTGTETAVLQLYYILHAIIIIIIIADLMHATTLLSCTPTPLQPEPETSSSSVCVLQSSQIGCVLISFQIFVLQIDGIREILNTVNYT